MHVLGYSFSILIHGHKKVVGFIIDRVGCKAFSKCPSISKRKVELQLRQQ
uniref:Uncharacterized protein n=1 Tax=Arundo donax TaxID=35708 RepID=A0A0A9A6D3_ARUDO